MKVIWQHHHRINVKRMRRFHVPQRVPQDAEVFGERYCTARTSFSEIRGDEIGCTRKVCASVLHDARLTLMLGLMKPSPTYDVTSRRCEREDNFLSDEDRLAGLETFTE